MSMSQPRGWDARLDPPMDIIRACVRECLDCHRVCLETVSQLQGAGALVSVSGIRLIFDCAELCRTTAGFLRGGSDLVRRACALCAEACSRCADYCEGLDGGGQQVAACAKALRRCAEACATVASLAA